MNFRGVITLLFFFTLVTNTFAAKAIEIPKSNDAQTKTQEKAPEAAAYQASIELNENTIDSTVDPVVMKEHRIVKLLSPEAVQRYASSLRFIYIEPDQKWTVDDVKITSPDGKTSELTAADETVSAPLSKIPPYDNLKVVSMQLKNLTPGSTLEYTATYTEKFWVENNYWESIFLQDQDPIASDRVVLIEKEGEQGQVKELHGSLPVPQTEHANGKVTRIYEWNNISPYPSNAEMNDPPPADIAPQFVLSSLSSWDKVAQAAKTKFLTPASPGNLDTILSSIRKGANDQNTKLRNTYAFVDEGLRSFPENFGGDFGRIPHPLDYDTILKLNVGDSRDKAALLFALLKKVGFEPEFALLSTSTNGIVPEDIPLPSAFNRLLVKMRYEGKTLWLDPYIENCPFGYLPAEDQGRKALLLSTGEFEETPVLPAADNSREVNVKASIRPDGGLVETLDFQTNGSDSIAIRTLLKSVSQDQREQLVLALASQITNNPKNVSVTLSSVDDLNHPLSVGLSFLAPNYATTAGDLTFLSMPFTNSKGLQSILDQSGTRQFPFILGTTTQEIKKLDLTLPKGFKLRYIPKGSQIKNPLGSYEARFTASKNKIMFESVFTLDKISIEPDEFADLKRLIADKVKVEGAKIVLEKEKKTQN